MEYELEAAFQHECSLRGARHQAYSAIVGGGNNSTVLHYVDNNDELKDGELVLVDAGCEVDCYASDITRTYPVNGNFTKEQKLLRDFL